MTRDDSTVDLLTFGETMLRLSPPQHERLETTDEVEVRAAGAESNVAVAARRLNARSVWASKVPESVLGHRVVDELHQFGIETAVTWSEEGRQGTYFLEFGNNPRGVNVIYDRDDAAVTTFTEAEFPTDRLEETDIVFTSGITPALSDQLAETTKAVFSAAKEAGAKTAFDVNYRSKLWDPSTAEETLRSIFPDVDMLFAAHRDAKTVLNFDGTPPQVAHRLGSEFDFDTVVLTRGDEGAVGWQDSVLHEQRAYETDTHDPIGTGDAFVGAFLASHNEGDSLDESLEYGAAMAALKRTIPGDMVAVTPEEVEAVRSEETVDIDR